MNFTPFQNGRHSKVSGEEKETNRGSSNFKDVVTADVLQSREKKVTAPKETKARFEDRLKAGKNRWSLRVNCKLDVISLLSRTQSGLWVRFVDFLEDLVTVSGVLNFALSMELGSC